MKLYIRILKSLTVATCGHRLYPEPDRRTDSADACERAQPAAIALPMSRSGIYGDYSLYRKPRHETSEAGHAEPLTAKIL
ncbi:MAG TPA: hypothetical protein VKB27_15755 [Gammaproteobacteria bacterium]|nr:hypothetical protein [Gammaproteobacteria bacterium]